MKKYLQMEKPELDTTSKKTKYFRKALVFSQLLIKICQDKLA